MPNKNNYLWKNPSSSFSQLNMDAKFNKNFLVQIIKSFCKPIRKRYDGHSSEEFPIVTLFNALVGNSQRTGTQILNRKLNAFLKNTSQPSTSKGRILLNTFEYFVNKGPPLSKFCRTKELIGKGCIII
ncbi:MAG: hypothetical protein ACTSR8_16610 [Promethearchaeota archaeon]